jgi:hypothetical protein
MTTGPVADFARTEVCLCIIQQIRRRFMRMLQLGMRIVLALLAIAVDPKTETTS